MKKITAYTNAVVPLALCTAVILMAGCATDDKSSSSSSATATAGTTGSSSSSSSGSMRYKATDGRTISIGTASASNGGRSFKEPHMDKCWVADGFDFKGYDTIYIAPVTSTVKVHDDEMGVQKIAQETLQAELKRMIAEKGLFTKVTTEDSTVKPGMKTLVLNNTVIEYSKGGGAARYFVGLYGGGQPNLKVQGVMKDGDKTVFTYTIRRSGVSGSARTGGAFMKDEDIQTQDVHSMVLDLTDFMAAVSGKYPAN